MGFPRLPGSVLESSHFNKGGGFQMEIVERGEITPVWFGTTGSAWKHAYSRPLAATYDLKNHEVHLNSSGDINPGYGLHFWMAEKTIEFRTISLGRNKLQTFSYEIRRYSHLISPIQRARTWVPSISKNKPTYDITVDAVPNFNKVICNVNHRGYTPWISPLAPSNRAYLGGLEAKMTSNTNLRMKGLNVTGNLGGYFSWSLIPCGK